MINKRPTLETILYLFAMLLAAGLRLYRLGATPLSDAEASWANQALQVSSLSQEGEDFYPSSHLAYTFLTGTTFLLLESSNFLARFWPALLGTSLVFIPVFVRKQLGRTPAILMAYGLAIDPGLVAVSRQASGPMLAMTFTLWAGAMGLIRRQIPFGIFAGLALLSGPGVWHGVLISLLLWAYIRLVTFPPSQDIQHEAGQSESQEPQKPRLAYSLFRPALTAGLLTLLMAGSFYMRFPKGLTTLFGDLVSYLQGWIIPSGVSGLQTALTFVFYQPLALFFAIFCIGRWVLVTSQGQHPGDVHRMAFPFIGVLASLGLTLLYPGRQTADLIWTLIPLWALAAIEMERQLPSHKVHQAAWLQAILTTIMLILFWNTLIATSRIAPVSGISWPLLRLIILLGILALAAMTTALVGLGWSWEASQRGSNWGLVAVLVIYTINAVWGASQLRLNQPQEFWGRSPGVGQAYYFDQTLQDLASWNTGIRNYLDIYSTVDTPSVRWALRDFEGVKYVNSIPYDILPAVIITMQEQEAPQLSASYRGQDFTWWVYPGWAGPFPPDFLAWLAYRQAPTTFQDLILWARSDLFPGGTLVPEEVPLDTPTEEDVLK